MSFVFILLLLLYATVFLLLQVYALSRDNGVPFSPMWRRIHPVRKVPVNAVWLCAAIATILGLPILKLNVIFSAIISISTQSDGLGATQFPFLPG